jgi:NAD(P)H dehydrogenase (quinone)
VDSLGRLWAQGKLADKAYAAFTSSQTTHGGQVTTLVGLYTSLMHFGGILVPPGYTDGVKFADGNPYGVSHNTGSDNQNPLDDTTVAALRHLAQRTVAVATLLAAG